ncbi:SWIM zinc finger family protein [Streptomyces sp. NBC_00083]|uniref:SWIM zinc finger family protein n=1 Tax=Streptomyces sp. NBC_00083 TaxID=2975647 RepID=UPI00224C82F4|nr:SWIM zinc finger family protein [Streptomyces sp. NBC_00083]MCX5385145.1 SWIM zinc finger domain-containing protein [Streptomyces sp. NBC_00083]
MTQQGVRWTAEQVLALAPDDASRKAGSRLGAAGPWSQHGCDGAGAVWGLCKGSGSTPYRTVVDTSGPAYKCSCPSRKFPCKHALGLLLLRSGDGWAVPDGAPPDWAEQWLAGRAGRTADKRLDAAGAGGVADPEAARRRAEKRAERITSGALELEQRLADLLRGGLATAERPGYGLWEETAARMVDAQAPGLAARVRELGAIPGSGPGWPTRLLEECALLHLLDRAWLGRAALPEPLAATVRTRVGAPTAPQGPAIRDTWQVLAQYDTADAKLTTRRIWLYGRESGRSALVLDFGAAGRAPALALPVGLAIDADLTPYPGAGQLRAALGERYAAPVAAGGPPPGGTTADAVERYGRALLDDPWLEASPATLAEVIPVPPGEGGDTWQLADAKGGLALPVIAAGAAHAGLWRLLALSGGAPVTVFGECGHRGFAPLAAWAEGAGEEVALT